GWPVLAAHLPKVSVHLVPHYLRPAARRRESHLLAVPPDLCTKGLDQQGLDVADRVLRLGQQSLGHFAKLPSPVRERTGQHRAKAEPRETVPPAGVAIVSM